MSIAYVYRENFSIPGVSAADAAAELQRLRREAGELTPDIVVDAARDEHAVLHPAFEWDDEIAAQNFRKQQARHLLRGVCIVRDEGEPIPMHFHIVTDDGGKYESVERIQNDPDLYEAALAELTSKVRGAQSAVDQLLQIGAKRLRGQKRKTAESVRKHLEEAEEALSVLS
jgi:hypothetical protein